MIIILIFNINGRITGLPFLHTCVACFGRTSGYSSGDLWWLAHSCSLQCTCVLVYGTNITLAGHTHGIFESRNGRAVIRPNHGIEYEFLILLIEMLCDDYSVVCIWVHLLILGEQEVEVDGGPFLAVIRT